ncbi:MAG TPA: GNAT family N-acetyltransferase [Pyrinomonadaceae bacterium]|nr:GNAT family N-acetyltransferase [Pyrinomonadaceae bacterium]
MIRQEWRRDEYTISTDPARLDVEMIHRFLDESSYWARGRTLSTVRRSIEHSFNFGIYTGDGTQVGFARVITDYATFAWLADVFIVEAHRGRGLGKWLVKVILGHADLQGFRRWLLATKDAHEIYRQFGFDALRRPERFMERADPAMTERPDYWATGDA